MTYKTILAAMSGGSASDAVAELACRLARRFEAHLEGFHVRLDAKAEVMAAASGFGAPLPNDWAEAMVADVIACAERTKAAFDLAVTAYRLLPADRPPVTAASAAWREVIGHAPALVSRHARFFDLLVLGRSERVADEPHTDTIEQVLLKSGRPIVLTPAKAPSGIGETIAIGWNKSPEAARAVAAALPFLQAARSVSLITIDGREEEEIRGVLDHLAWHGIAAVHRSVRPIPGVRIGAQLLSEAHEGGADLLVMGAYGRMPWREMLFGGASRQVISASMLPVFLSH